MLISRHHRHMSHTFDERTHRRRTPSKYTLESPKHLTAELTDNGFCLTTSRPSMLKIRPWHVLSHSQSRTAHGLYRQFDITTTTTQCKHAGLPEAGLINIYTVCITSYIGMQSLAGSPCNASDERYCPVFISWGGTST